MVSLILFCMLTKTFIFNAHHQGLRLSIGRCRCYFFPHPLSQLLVTALRSIPANYSHEFPRTKTAQCERSEARPPPRRTRAILRPGGGDGRARSGTSIRISRLSVPLIVSVRGWTQRRVKSSKDPSCHGEDRDYAAICGECREISSRWNAEVAFLRPLMPVEMRVDYRASEKTSCLDVLFVTWI